MSFEALVAGSADGSGPAPRSPRGSPRRSPKGPRSQSPARSPTGPPASSQPVVVPRPREESEDVDKLLREAKGRLLQDVRNGPAEGWTESFSCAKDRRPVTHRPAARRRAEAVGEKQGPYYQPPEEPAEPPAGGSCQPSRASTKSVPVREASAVSAEAGGENAGGGGSRAGTEIATPARTPQPSQPPAPPSDAAGGSSGGSRSGTGSEPPAGPEIIMTGWLQKKGEGVLAQSHRRWFVLSCAALEYFVDDAGGERRGGVPIATGTEARAAHGDPRDLVLSGVGCPRAFELRAGSAELRDAWLAAFVRAASAAVPVPVCPGAAPRDWGLGLATCSACARKLVPNRGCGGCGRRLCDRCFRAHCDPLAGSARSHTDAYADPLDMSQRSQPRSPSGKPASEPRSPATPNLAAK